MLLWLTPVFLLALLAAFGFALLRHTCARRELPEGWEEKRIGESGNVVRQETFAAGRAWLERHETEELEVQSEDGFLLHGLLAPHVSPRFTLIMFHGWRSSWEMDFLPMLPFLYGLGAQLLLVDERAQGDSEGRYMTFGVRERTDVSVWVDYAASRFGEKHPIFLHGLSMGATAVLMAASYRFGGSVRGIIADCGFTSPHEIISHVWREKTPFPAHFAVWLLDKFTRLFADFGLKECHTVKALSGTDCPVLFIHGTKDKLVPPYMTRQAYDACTGRKTLVLAEGAGHGMSYLTDRTRFEAAYRAFIESGLNNRTDHNG